MADSLNSGNGAFRVNDSGVILTPSVGAASFSSEAIPSAGGLERRSGGGIGVKAKAVTGDMLGTSAGRPLLYSLSTTTGGGGALSLENTSGGDLWIMSADLAITTAASGGVTLDIGIGASGSTSYDTLLDGVAASATGGKNAYDDKGTNGKVPRKWPSGQFVTATWSGSPGSPVAKLRLVAADLTSDIST